MGKPKIRFKGFTEDWEQRKLSELVLLITKGTTPLDKSGNGEINFIKIENIDPSSGEITPEMKISKKEHNGYLKRSQLQENDILFSIAGTLGRVSIVKSCVLPANTNQALAIIRTKEGDLRYLTTVLKGNAVADFIRKNPTVGAQPNLSLEQVGNIELPYPSMAEQEKIGEYFSSLDHLITLHQRKCDETKKLKKYMLQKMFPQNGMKVPEIRLEGFTGDWEQRKLGEICLRVQGNDGRMELPTLTISAGNGWMRQEDRFSGNIAGKELKNYTLLRKGELSYNHGNSKLAKYGAVFSLQTYEEALVPRVYHSFKVIKGNADFVEYYFATKLLDRELGKLISSGARMDGLLNIGYDEFMGIPLMVPTTEEQMKIAIYFRNLDHLITLHQQKCDELVKIKKYMLQNMFV